MEVNSGSADFLERRIRRANFRQTQIVYLGLEGAVRSAFSLFKTAASGSFSLGGEEKL
jgi:hypothetical protein